MKRYTKSLAETHPDLAAQWHPTKNGELTPYDVTAGTDKSVWWLLPYDVPNDYPVEHLRGRHFDFEWDAIVYSRTSAKNGCPYLSGNAVWVGFNDLPTTHPDLAAQWHPTKNGNLTPYDVTAGYGKKVWWMLPYDVPNDYSVKHLRGKHFDFEWETKVCNRTSAKNGCPYLSGRAVWVGFNDLPTTHPDLAAQWHPTKNGNLTPYDVTAGYTKKVWWLLPFDVPNDYPVEHLRGKHFDFEWESVVKNRTSGSGCPYLSGQAIWIGFNDLSTTHPDIAAQWHPIRNGDLKPKDVTVGYHGKVWWLLPFDVPNDYPVEHLRGKHFDFEWEAKVCNRTYTGNGCPYLSGQAIWIGFNDLSTTHPDIAAEWHPIKNGDLKPENVTAAYKKNVWWYIIDEKNCIHEWSTAVRCRTFDNTGCPDFKVSHGEKFIKKYLKNKKIEFESQKTFSGLFGVKDRKLLYDIYFKLNNTTYLVEYNGIQHYKPVDIFGGNEQFLIQQEHDRRKREYAKENNINLIEISYKYDTYEKVAQYLDEVLIA